MGTILVPQLGKARCDKIKELPSQFSWMIFCLIEDNPYSQDSAIHLLHTVSKMGNQQSLDQGSKQKHLEEMKQEHLRFMEVHQAELDLVDQLTPVRERIEERKRDTSFYCRFCRYSYDPSTLVSTLGQHMTRYHDAICVEDRWYLRAYDEKYPDHDFYLHPEKDIVNNHGGTELLDLFGLEINEDNLMCLVPSQRLTRVYAMHGDSMMAMILMEMFNTGALDIMPETLSRVKTELCTNKAQARFIRYHAPEDPIFKSLNDHSVATVFEALFYRSILVKGQKDVVSFLTYYIETQLNLNPSTTLRTTPFLTSLDRLRIFLNEEGENQMNCVPATSGTLFIHPKKSRRFCFSETKNLGFLEFVKHRPNDCILCGLRKGLSRNPFFLLTMDEIGSIAHYVLPHQKEFDIMWRLQIKEYIIFELHEPDEVDDIINFISYAVASNFFEAYRLFGVEKRRALNHKLSSLLTARKRKLPINWLNEEGYSNPKLFYVWKSFVHSVRIVSDLKNRIVFKTSYWNRICPSIEGVSQLDMTVVTTAMSGVWDAIRTFFYSAYTLISSNVGAAVSVMKSSLTSFLNFFRPVLGTALSCLMQMFNTVISGTTAQLIYAIFIMSCYTACMFVGGWQITRWLIWLFRRLCQFLYSLVFPDTDELPDVEPDDKFVEEGESQMFSFSDFEAHATDAWSKAIDAMGLCLSSLWPSSLSIRQFGDLCRTYLSAKNTFVDIISFFSSFDCVRACITWITGDANYMGIEDKRILHSAVETVHIFKTVHPLWLTEIPTSEALSDEIVSMHYEITSNQYRILASPILNPAQKHCYTALVREVSDMYRTASALRPTATVRATPACAIFFGPGGEGKSTAVNNIVKWLYYYITQNFGDLFPEYSGPWSPAQMWTKNDESPYWEGYSNQFCYVIRELCQVIEPTKRAEQLREFQGVVDSMAFPCNMSTAEAKGAVYFKTPLVLVNSNLADFANVGMTDPAAILRRFHFPFHFVRNEYVDIDNPNVSLADLNRAWVFQPADRWGSAPLYPHVPSLKPMCFSEVVQAIGTFMVAEQRNRLARITNLHVNMTDLSTIPLPQYETQLISTSLGIAVDVVSTCDRTIEELQAKQGSSLRISETARAKLDAMTKYDEQQTTTSIIKASSRLPRTRPWHKAGPAVNESLTPTCSFSDFVQTEDSPESQVLFDLIARGAINAISYLVTPSSTTWRRHEFSMWCTLVRQENGVTYESSDCVVDNDIADWQMYHLLEEFYNKCNSECNLGQMIQFPRTKLLMRHYAYTEYLKWTQNSEIVSVLFEVLTPRVDFLTNEERLRFGYFRDFMFSQDQMVWAFLLVFAASEVSSQKSLQEKLFKSCFRAADCETGSISSQLRDYLGPDYDFELSPFLISLCTIVLWVLSYVDKLDQNGTFFEAFQVRYNENLNDYCENIRKRLSSAGEHSYGISNRDSESFFSRCCEVLRLFPWKVFFLMEFADGVTSPDGGVMLGKLVFPDDMPAIKIIDGPLPVASDKRTLVFRLKERSPIYFTYECHISHKRLQEFLSCRRPTGIDVMVGLGLYDTKKEPINSFYPSAVPLLKDWFVSNGPTICKILGALGLVGAVSACAYMGYSYAMSTPETKTIIAQEPVVNPDLTGLQRQVKQDSRCLATLTSKKDIILNDWQKLENTPEARALFPDVTDEEFAQMVDVGTYYDPLAHLLGDSFVSQSDDPERDKKKLKHEPKKLPHKPRPACVSQSELNTIQTRIDKVSKRLEHNKHKLKGVSQAGPPLTLSGITARVMKVGRNMSMMYLRNATMTDPYIMWCFGLKGRLILVCKHYRRSLSKCDRMAIVDDRAQTPEYIFLSQVSVHEVPGRDLEIWELPRGSPYRQYKDMTKYLPTSTELQPLYRPGSVIRPVVEESRGIRNYSYIQNTKIVKRESFEMPMGATNMDGERVQTVVKDYYRAFSFPNSSGVCMTVYLHADVSNPRKHDILGFHIGAHGGDSVLCPLYVSDVKELGESQISMEIPRFLKDEEITKPFVPIKGLKHFFSVKRPSFLPVDTCIQRSIIYPELERLGHQIETEPALLRPTYVEQADGSEVLVNPLKIALSKFEGSCVIDEPEAYQHIMENPSYYWEGFVDPDIIKRVTPYTLKQALLGEPGVCASMDNSTSETYWGKLKGFTRKDLWDVDQKTINPVIEREVNNLIEDISQRKQYHGFCSGCLKDETRERSRVRQGKTRLFCIFDLAQIIVMKMYAGPIIDLVKEHLASSPSCVGINPHSGDWRFIYDRLREFPNWKAEDKERFDLSVSKIWSKVVFDFYLQFYGTPGPEETIWWILSAICEMYTGPIMIIYGDAWLWPRGVASGMWATSHFDTFVSWCYIRYCWRTLVPERFSIDKHLFAALYGDDDLESVSNAVAKYYNMRTCHDALSRIGVPTTMPDKSAISTDFIAHSSVSFLGRDFVHIQYEGSDYIAPRLQWSSVLGMLAWTRKSAVNTPEEAISQNMDVALRELVYYGKETFDHWHQMFTRFAQEYSLPYIAPFRTWEEGMSSFVGSHFD